MERTLIKDLGNKIGEEVSIQGWLQTLRDQKSMQFLIIRDRTGLVQVAHWKKGNPELAEQICPGNGKRPDPQRQGGSERSSQTGRHRAAA